MKAVLIALVFSAYSITIFSLQMKYLFEIRDYDEFIEQCSGYNTVISGSFWTVITTVVAMLCCTSGMEDKIEFIIASFCIGCLSTGIDVYIREILNESNCEHFMTEMAPDLNRIIMIYKIMLWVAVGIILLMCCIIPCIKSKYSRLSTHAPNIEMISSEV